ncbi:MAG: protein kinase [Pleurocapsa sp.]
MDNNLVGTTIQRRYYVVKQLGRGGVGVTFLAQDRQCFDSQCVVKQLKPKTVNPKTLAIARRLFKREAEIMNCLGHCDRIPRLLAYFEHNNDFFLVQELIEGHDLSQEIISGKPWSEAKTIDLLKDILEVLLVVQQHGVIHRDLKPSNLMRRSQDRKIVLIDFGSVKQISTQIIDPTGQVKQTIAVGTKSYMPMEQMMGRPGFYSDIYAVGVIAIQALTGMKPQKLGSDENGAIIWRNQLASYLKYQPRLLDILDKMVRHRHQERYTSAEVVLSELKQLDAAPNNTKATIIVPHRSPAPPQLTQLPQSNSHRETKILTSQPTPAMAKAVSQNLLATNDLEAVAASPVTLKIVPNIVKSRRNPKFAVVSAVIVMLTILTTAAAGGWLIYQQKTTESGIALSLYENSDRGFKVNYPQVWSQQNRDDFFATGVIFFSPLENDADRFKETVSVLVENLSDDMTLAQYTAQSISEIKRLSDPNVGQAQIISLGEIEGRQVVYGGEENGKRVRRMQTWSIQDNRAYVITYTALPESFENYLVTVEKMIESFEIIDR